MKKKSNKRFLGMTQTELLILVIMGGLLICVLALFGGYIIYDLNRANPVAVLQPTSIPQSIIPPPIQPTNPPLPIQPSDMPIPQPTPTTAPTRIPAPTTAPQIGTFNNPVPIGVGYTFPGLGTLTVIRSSWLPGQTGFAIVEILLSCERPAEQECNTYLLFDSLGGSGNGYEREFDSAIPNPSFGTYDNPPVFGGGAEKGYVGFLITSSESTLVMRVRLPFGGGEFFFKISN